MSGLPDSLTPHNFISVSNVMWRLTSDQALLFRCWNDIYVVYNRLSGDTHLLGSTAAQMLLKLKEAPSNVPALTESIAPQYQAGMDDELALEVEHILADLEALALIERIRF